MPALRAVTLDFGTTLVYERPSRYAIYAEAARSRGASISDEEMRGFMLRAHQELPQVVDGAFRYTDRWFRRFIERIFHTYLELPANDLPGLEDELFARFDDPATFRLQPGARELLTGIRRAGLGLGLVSNWSARLPRLLVALELAIHFDFVLCSALEGLEKPDPALFRLAAERADVRPEQLLHAGDDPVRDGGATHAGLEVILVDPLGRRAAADGFERVADLEQLLERIEDRRGAP